MSSRERRGTGGAACATRRPPKMTATSADLLSSSGAQLLDSRRTAAAARNLSPNWLPARVRALAIIAGQHSAAGQPSRPTGWPRLMDSDGRIWAASISHASFRQLRPRIGRQLLESGRRRFTSLTHSLEASASELLPRQLHHKVSGILSL